MGERSIFPAMTHQPALLESRVWSSETLNAALTSVDFQQCKTEELEKEIQAGLLLA